MRGIQKSFIALLLLSLTHYTSAVNFTSYFSKAPVQVLNETDSQGIFSDPFLVPTGSDSTIAIFGMNSDDNNFNFSRRIVDSSTFAQIGNDSQLDFSIFSEEIPFVAASPSGMVAVASDDRLNLTNEIFISFFPANYVDENTSNVTTLQMTFNTDPTVDYQFAQFFYLNGYFYILYTACSEKNTSENYIYLQGISESNHNVTQFESPLQLTVNDSVAERNPFARCGQHGTYQKLLCMWKRVSKNSTVSVEVDLINKQVSAETELAHDSNEWYYRPLEVVNYDKHCAHLIAVSDNANVSSQTDFLSMKVKVSFLSQVYALPYSLPSDMQEYTYVGAGAYYGGWYVLNNQYYADPDTSEPRSSVGVNIYQKDGSMNGTQHIIAYNGTASGLLTRGGSVYVLVKNSSQNFGNDWDVAYLGQLYSSTSYPPQQPKFAAKIALPYLSLIIVIITFYII